MMNRVLTNVLAVIASLLMGLLGSSGAKAQDLTVCLWGTITGPDASVNGMTYGMRDYFEFLNRFQGGILGTNVRTVLLDGRYRLDEELKNYRRCVDQEKAVLVSGWSTGATKALRDQISSDKVPFMSQSFASDALDPQQFPYIFIAGATYEQQIMIALRDLKARGGKRVVFMFADNEFGRAPIANVQKLKQIEELGLELVDSIEFKFDGQDFTGQVLRAKQANADMIYLQSSAGPTLAILRDAAKIGLKTDLFISNFYNLISSIPAQLGPAAEGFRAVQLYANWGDDVPAMKDILSYSRAQPVDKKDIYFMKGWMEGIAAAEAIRRTMAANGGKVPADLAAFRIDVRDALAGIKELDAGGIVPSLNFSKNQGSIQARISQVMQGIFVSQGPWIDAGK
jgi:branched-chain amino acid transport system substrate-binding protein